MPEESDRWLGSLWLLRPDFSWDGRSEGGIHVSGSSNPERL